jgi:concentrative nucleoside transporter, CNT family
MLAVLLFTTLLSQSSADQLIAQGQTLQNLHQYQQAEQIFLQLVGVDPDNLAAREHLRRIYIEQNQSERLLSELANLVEGYVKQKEFELAGKRLDELLALSPSHPKRAAFETALGRTTDKTPTAGKLEERLRSLFGVFLILGIAYAMSNNRKAIKWRTVRWGLGLQVIFAMIILWTPPGRWFFDQARAVITRLLSFTDEGARFLFGKLYEGVAPGLHKGPTQVIDGTSGDFVNLGFVFVFHVLPVIVFFGALMAVLYHFGILQKAVHGIAWVVTKTMGTSGAESLNAAGNIFLGQVEAPLLIRPYVNACTRSELMSILTAGFAMVSGSVLGVYVRFGIDAGHLLSASVMAAPGSLMLAKMIVPETQVPQTQGGHVHDPKSHSVNVIDAAATGAMDGFKIAGNVAAMLIAFIALITMVNYGLGWFGLSLKVIFSYVLYPLSWSMGVSKQDLFEFGNLLGTKISINEFVAYVDLTHIRHQLTHRTYVLATYALCGFANFASIGVQIGGIGVMAPDRRQDLAQLGLRAMVAGTLASCLTACIAGVLL